MLGEKSRERIAIALLFGLYFAAVFLPLGVCIKFGIYWGALAFVLTCFAWVLAMPISCMSGGLIFSLMAVTILLGTFISLGLAALSFAIRLF